MSDPISDRTAELAAFHAETFGPSATSSSNGLRPDVPDMDVGEIIRRASAARNGAKFLRLFRDGDVSGYATPSEADLALCGMLAFWTRNADEVTDELFRQSGLMRPKWDEPHGAKNLRRNDDSEGALLRGMESEPSPRARRTRKSRLGSGLLRAFRGQAGAPGSHHCKS